MEAKIQNRSSTGNLKVYPRILARDLIRNRYLYLMIFPVLAYYIIFFYGPMYGALIAFKDFNPMKGILGSDWIGMEHFKTFITGVYFWRTLRNTVLISVYSIIFGFPAPIIMALLLNEVRNTIFKRTVQTLTYVPHFISMVVVCGLILDFTSSTGFVNNIFRAFGGPEESLMLKAEYFRTIYISTDIWKEFGWNSIIYLAALSAIDPQLYEAAIIDGANRWKQLLHITIPCLIPTIIILLILRLGRVMNVGFEKVILLYNPNTYETADVISSYVYRKGLLEFSYSYSAAVGLFNSAINFTILLASNYLSKKTNETSLW